MHAATNTARNECGPVRCNAQEEKSNGRVFFHFVIEHLIDYMSVFYPPHFFFSFFCPGVHAETVRCNSPAAVRAHTSDFLTLSVVFLFPFRCVVLQLSRLWSQLCTRDSKWLAGHLTWVVTPEQHDEAATLWLEPRSMTGTSLSVGLSK